jgi:flagellar FliJ protein
MRKFRFNLQRVLDYRGSIEEKLLAELAAARAHHDREVARLLEISRSRNLYRRKMRKQLTGADADAIRQAHNYLDDLVRRLKSQEIAVTRAADLKDKKTAEVIEASKDRKVLERLRDYKLLEYTSEAQSLEQKFLDDIASIRSNRAKSRSGSAGGGFS